MGHIHVHTLCFSANQNYELSGWKLGLCLRHLVLYCALFICGGTNDNNVFTGALSRISNLSRRVLVCWGVNHESIKLYSLPFINLDACILVGMPLQYLIFH